MSGAGRGDERRLLRVGDDADFIATIRSYLKGSASGPPSPDARSHKILALNKTVKAAAAADNELASDMSDSVPITAYCLAFKDWGGTGCYLKVSQARPGSSLRFCLRSSAGEEVEKVMALPAGGAPWGEFFYLKGSSRHQARLTGTVEYVDEPATKWAVATTDPDAVTTFYSDGSMMGLGVAFPTWQTKVPMGNGKIIKLLTQKIKGDSD